MSAASFETKSEGPVEIRFDSDDQITVFDQDGGLIGNVNHTHIEGPDEDGSGDCYLLTNILFGRSQRVRRLQAAGHRPRILNSTLSERQRRQHPRRWQPSDKKRAGVFRPDGKDSLVSLDSDEGAE